MENRRNMWFGGGEWYLQKKVEGEGCLYVGQGIILYVVKSFTPFSEEMRDLRTTLSVYV